MSLERFTRRELVTIAPDRTARDAAELMRTHHVGAVLVVDGGQPVGIVTDRDLVVRLLAEGFAATTPVRSVMSGDLVTARVDDSIDHAIYTMRHHGVRRLPIIAHDGAALGLVALDDLLVLLSGEVSSVVEAVIDNRGP